MPDFDKNLQPILKDASLPSIDVDIKAPKEYASLQFPPAQVPVSDLSKEEDVYAELNRRGQASNFEQKGVFVTNAVLDANKRYAAFNPTINDYEDFAGYGQSGFDKAKNGVLKGLNLAATTVAGGFAVLGGAAMAPFTGRLADIWDNKAMRAIDTYNNKVDNEFLPNYYTAAERNAAWYSTSNWMTTNFLFDKLIKNSGFAVGAMVGGTIFNAGLLKLGQGIGKLAAAGAATAEGAEAFKIFTPLLRNTARAFSAGKNIEAAKVLEGELSSIADVSAKSSELGSIADGSKLTNQFAKFGDTARRIQIAAYSTGGEAAFEAIQTSKEYRNNLIQSYKDSHQGAEPTGADLISINESSEAVGKTSFFGNLALLSLTEYVQLPHQLGSTYSATKQAANTLLGQTEDVVLKGGKYAAQAGPKTTFGKLFTRARRVGAYVFDPKEAGQEIGQYALQIGTENYFKKSRESDAASVWADGFLYGMVGKDERGEGVGALNSKAGIESGILGGLTGGLMQVHSGIQERKATLSNTQQFIQSLDNAPSFQQAYKERMAAANRAVVLQQQEQDAIVQGDKLEAKDLHADLMHTYLAPRIKYGRYDMISEDIQQLKRDGITEEGLASLKEQGLANLNDTVQQFQERLTKFQEVAKNTQEIYKATNLSYAGEPLRDEQGQPIVDEKGQTTRKYSPIAIDKMVYAASKIADYDIRIPQVNSPLLTAGVNTAGILESIFKNNRPNIEATDEALTQINNFDTTSDKKDELKTALSDVIELSLRRKQFIQEYDDIKSKPLNYANDFTTAEEVKDVVVDQVETVKGKAPEVTQMKLEVGKEYSLVEPLRKEGSNLHLAPKLTVLSETLGGEFEVRLPGGKVAFITPTEFKKYNITEENNDSPELTDLLDKAVDTVLNSPEYAEVKKELSDAKPTSVNDKLSFLNSLDNQKLIDAVEKEFNTKAATLLKEKEATRKSQQKLLKNKEQLDKQQAKIELNAGDIGTGSPTEEADLPEEDQTEEGKLKAADIFYISGVSQFETEANAPNAPTHVKNSRVFLNNLSSFKNRANLRAILVTPNNETALGLEGLTQLSYPEGIDADSTNVDNGFVAQVFIEQDGGKTYFVDKDGNRIKNAEGKDAEVGTPIDVNQVIFQTMPTTKTEDSRNQPRYRKGEKEQLTAQANAWKAFREDLFKSTGAEFIPYPFNVSRGIGIKNPNAENNHVGEVLIPNTSSENAEKILASTPGIIQISVSGSIIHKGQSLKFPKGRPVFQLNDTLQFLNNTVFGKAKATTIFQVIKAFAKDIQDQSDAGKQIELDVKLATYLMNVLYFRKSAQTTGNQIFIDTNNMTISLGGQSYPISEIANNEAKIITQLTDTYHNINKESLKGQNIKTPFYEYVYENGKLEETKWRNYQTYLLSSKTADKKANRSVDSTPLVTGLAKADAGVPYSFQQKYATLQGVDMQVQAVVATPTKVTVTPEGAPTVGGFVVDGITPNTYTKFKAGEVDFTAKPDPDNAGDFLIGIIPNEVTDKLATPNDDGSKNATVVAMADILKADDKLDLLADDKKIIIDGLSGIIGGKLKEAYAEEQEKDIAPEVTVTAVTEEPVIAEEAFVSDKADIERRRQEELKKIGFDIREERDEHKYLEDKNTGEIVWMDGISISPFFDSSVGIIKQDGTTFIVPDLKNYKSTDKKVLIFNEDYFRGITKKHEFVLTFPSDLSKGQYKLDNELLPDVVSKINAKYDAELAKLGSKEATVKVIKPKTGKRPNDGYRRVEKTKGSTAKMTDAEIEFFKQYAEKNVDFPIEILEQLVDTYDNEKAYGVFEDGVIKFYRGAIKGTEYHELGEAVWNGLLTPEEQAAIIADEKVKGTTFVDRETGRTYDYATASDQKIKERILDDFADYRAGKLTARSLGQKVLDFFKRIINFFKTFGTKPSLKTELFKAIDAGKFKNYTVSGTNNAPQYRRTGKIEGVNETLAYYYVQDMFIRASNIIFGENNKDLLYDVQKITGKEIYNKIKELYIDEDKYEGEEGLSETQFNQLFKRTKDLLRTIGVTINEEDTADINDGETNNRGYVPEPFATDWKKTSMFAIKLLAATNPQTAPTNQQNATTLKLPERMISMVEGYITNNFSRIFATLSDKLSNTTDPAKMVEKLHELAKDDANYVRIFKNIGGDLNNENGVIDFSNFKKADWRFLVNFFQTFNKQRPEALIEYTSGGNVYTGSADVYTASREIQKNWFEAMKTLSDNPDSIISKDYSKKVYKVKELKADAFPVKTPVEQVNFLSALGIAFSLEDYANLKTDQQNEFGKAVSDIRRYLESKSELGSLNGKTLGINGYLTTLSELLVKVTNPNRENTFANAEGSLTNAYADNNTASVFENEFNSVTTLDELLAARPELNDVFSKNNVTFREGGEFIDEDGIKIKDIKVLYISGKKDLDTNKGTSTSSLTEGQRYTQEINQNIQGNYYILIPGESATQWMMNLGNAVSFEDFRTGRATKEINKIFRGYLSDDLSLALDYKNRETLRNVGSKAKELRFFKDFLSDLNTDGELVPSAFLTEIDRLIADPDVTQKEIEEYIDENIEEVNSRIKSFIDDMVANTKSELMKNDQIELNVDKQTYSYPGLDNKFIESQKINPLNKYKLSESDLNNILLFTNTNYTINNIEFHKILFGDPYQFAVKNGNLEETKRLKSFLGTKRFMYNTNEYNTALNNDYNSAGEIELAGPSENSFGDVGYHEHKDYANTVSLADIKLSDSTYDNINEADAQSIIIDVAYREVKLKNGQWSDNEAEPFHQWQMAYTRQNMPEYDYSDDARGKALDKQDKALVAKPCPEYVLDIIKPLAAGIKNNEKEINLVLDKYSQMPLYYSTAQNRNLEKLYVKMWKEQIDYAIFESGRKLGIEKTHSLYTKGGEFNEEPFANDTLVQVPWSIYGTQLETAYEYEKDQTWISQLGAMSSVNLYANGEPVGATPQRKKAIKKEYERNTNIVKQLHNHKAEVLLKKLGVQDTVNGYILKDPKIVSETLQRELKRQVLSNNALDTVELDENGQFAIPFEASPVYTQIKGVFYSMINKSIISMKMNGGSKTQASVTLWENAKEGRGIAEKTKDGYKKLTIEEYNALPEDRKKNVVLTSDTLKFYEDENGKRVCEIMIPPYFKDAFDPKKFPTEQSIMDYLNSLGEEGQEILRGVGARIPVQSMSSIEVFKVKSFLPKYMGDTVIVPSQITTKTNSDFDIDKLNTYLRSVYKDENGNVRLIRYKGSEKATKQFYSDVFTATTQKQINEVSKDNFFRTKLINFFTKVAALPEINRDAIMSVLDVNALKEDSATPEYDFFIKYEDLLQTINRQAKEADLSPADYIISEVENKKADLTAKLLSSKLREDYVDEMYTKALQNEYYDSLEKLLTLPENFKHLISPVDDAGLSDVAKQLDKLRGEGENNIKNRILDRNYMTSLRQAFLITKKWVGIVAQNIKSQSLTQKTKVYINPANISQLSDADKAILGDGSILLPHNKVNVDGEEFASISGVLTADGKEYISSRLSGYGTAVVDVVNNPFIRKIIGSKLAVNTFMFLERIGCGERTPMFMNQPIITEYLKYLDGQGYSFLYKESNLKYIKNKFGASPIDIANATLNVDQLEKNISDYSEKGFVGSSKYNAEQQLILKEFLKYARMADFSSKLIQATNYDTSKSKSLEAHSRKKTKTELARDTNIFSGVDELLKSSYIGNQKDLLDKLMSALGGIMKLESPDFSIITNEAMRTYEEREFMSGDDFDKVASKMKAAFLDYIIQVNSPNLASEIEELFASENSVADQLLTAQKKYPEMKLLQDFEIRSSDRFNSAKTIKLRVNLKEAYDENLYIEFMRELKEIDKPLFDNLVKVAILQGTYQSAVSIKNIIPVEDYAAIVKPIIDSLISTPDIKLFSKGMFQRASWNDDVVFPEFNPRFVPNVMRYGDEHYPIAEDEFGNEVYQYVSDVIPRFELPTGIFGNLEDRRILLMNPVFNPVESKSDFIKVRRTQTLKNGDVMDFTTGQSIVSSDYRRRREAGDLSLRDVYGYQKVYIGDSPIVTPDGLHVYKLINLRGDGANVTEHYADYRKSVLNNGTVKIDQEIPDADIIKYFNATPDVDFKETEAPASTEAVSIPIKIDTSKKINIYAGTGENAELSNFANRPFEIKGYKFNSVEQAFQEAKYEFTKRTAEDAQIRINIQNASSSAEVKRLGSKYPTLDTKAWDSKSSDIMKRIIKLSFEQNPNALNALLATGNSELTHTQDNTKWGKEFPRLLMEVRNELRPTQAVSDKKELFSFEKGIAQKSFRGKVLNFVDKIPTNKETVVAMSNDKETGVISIATAAMIQKFNDKAWTAPAKQSDGSFATPLSENEFKSLNEWFTFGLTHEVKHDTIFKEEGETTGQYEDRINQAALEDLRKNYNIPSAETFDSLTEFTPERKTEILTNFGQKYPLFSKEQNIEFINDELAKDKDATIQLLKDCY